MIATCRECKEPVRGHPHLLLGLASTNSRLCVPCATDLQKQNGIPMNLEDFIIWYVRNRVQITQNEQIRMLEDRIAELETKLNRAAKAGDER